MVTQPDGSVLFLQNALLDLGTVPGGLYPGSVVLYERPVRVEGVAERTAAGAEAWPPVGDGAAVSGDLRLVHRFLSGLCHALSKTQFPDVQILQFAFFGPFIGALARSLGGMISDRLGVRALRW